jgi:ERCC4-type nuclease
MPAVCRIVVDDREPVERVERWLAQRGIDVRVARLRHGDYLLPNGVIVERKTVYGFHASIVEGRFWRQLSELRAATRAPYLLIEGRDLDAGQLSTRSLIGACLGVVGQGVPILWSSDESRTAEWLASLALRASGRQPIRDRPAYAFRKNAPADRVGEAMLAAVPGISTTRALAPGHIRQRRSRSSSP